jgi:hypothetical protein
MRSRDLLKKERINARLIRTPSGLRKKSCGYSLLVTEDFDKALKLIQSNGIPVIGTSAVDFK